MTLSLFLLFLPLHTYASEPPPTLYTIQAGSFTNIAYALEQFDLITQQLNEKELDYLRIEKVGKFYSVRIGKFEGYSIAKKFLQAIKPQLSTAIILEAYIKYENFIMLYAVSSSDDKDRAKEKSLLSPIPEKIKLQATKRSDKRIKTEISTENNKKAEVHFNRGVSYGIFGKHQEAVKAFKQAVRINPDYVEAHYNLGVAYGKSGKYPETIESYKQAIRIKPDYVEAHYNLGVAYGKSGKYPEAIEAFKEAIRIKPDYADAHYILGVAYAKSGKYPEAIEAFKEVMRRKPENADTYVNLGVAYGKSGMYKEAVDVLKQAIRVNPNNAEAHYNLGFSYLMLNDKSSAINEYEILKNLNTGFANMLFRQIHE